MKPCLICGGEVRLDNPEEVAAAAAVELALKSTQNTHYVDKRTKVQIALV